MTYLLNHFTLCLGYIAAPAINAKRIKNINEDAKGIISRGKVNENTLLHYGPALSGKIAYAIIAFRTLASSGTTSLCSCPLCR